MWVGHKNTADVVSPYTVFVLFFHVAMICIFIFSATFRAPRHSRHPNRCTELNFYGLINLGTQLRLWDVLLLLLLLVVVYVQSCFTLRRLRVFFEAP